MFNNLKNASIWVKAAFIGCSIGLVSSSVLAAPAKSSVKADDKVEFKSSLPVTQEEIAAVNVLGEICPKLLGNDPKFNAGYEHLLSELLPNIKQPVLSLKALQDDAEYQKILAQARADANKATVKDNREVCQEITQYNSTSNNAANTVPKKIKK